MSKQAPVEPPVEVLLEFREQDREGFESTLEAVAALGSRILHSYPPWLAVVAIAADRLEALRDCAGVRRVYPGQADQAALEALPDEMKWAVQAWNLHVSRSGKAGTPPARPAEGLAWDAPGHLPPDPPPAIQAELKRRSSS